MFFHFGAQKNTSVECFPSQNIIMLSGKIEVWNLAQRNKFLIWSFQLLAYILRIAGAQISIVDIFRALITKGCQREVGPWLMNFSELLAFDCTCTWKSAWSWRDPSFFEAIHLRRGLKKSSPKAFRHDLNVHYQTGLKSGDLTWSQILDHSARILVKLMYFSVKISNFSPKMNIFHYSRVFSFYHVFLTSLFFPKNLGPCAPNPIPLC